MAFELEKLFVDVFAPQDGDIVLVMYDLPHGAVQDNKAWQDRRKMAAEWHQAIEDFAGKYGMNTHPILTYSATGSHNADLPEIGDFKGEQVRLEEIIKASTIIIAMPEFSPSAPLLGCVREFDYLRVASMPMVSKSMEATGLSADYREIAATCARIAPYFEKADGVEVTFSTGHVCTFDISDRKMVFQDTGLLHPGTRKEQPMMVNLPAGEVFVCPNEAVDSQTAGEIPTVIANETMVFIVQNNQIVDIQGDGPVAAVQRQRFQEEMALRNIAEVAIGCNDKAVVTGNPLEDEKAGFHWAYGRSDHFGGKVGVDSFSSPDKVAHVDIVYAKGNPIVCARFDFIFPDGERKTAIVDGELIL
jgi:hypothetical protein